MDAPRQPYDQRKRTRQACEPCRRKKSKCTGERPGCSTCARLRQRCFYAAELRSGLGGEPSTADGPTNVHGDTATSETLSNRVRSLESTLAQVLENLRQNGQSQHAPRPSPRHGGTDGDATTAIPSAESLPASHRLATTDLLPPWPVVLTVARDYLRYCDIQPIPLFDPESFIDTLADRDPEVIYGVLALAGRFSGDQDSPQQRDGAAYTREAHRLVMERVTEGRVELSTIQSLCLLSLIEFYDGSIDQSRMHGSLAITLAHCAGMHREFNRLDSQPLAEERRRCYWGVVMLLRLLGWASQGGWEESNRGSQALLFPTSYTSPLAEAPETGHRTWTEAERLDGILSTVLQLAEIWSLTQDYVRTRGRSGGGRNAVAPWAPTSQYSRALQTLMDVGRDLPALHRDRCIRLADVTTEDLHSDRSRAYWAPWFLCHFLYHTSICLLNHPLLMTLQFQGGRGFSEVFLQQTAHLASYHTLWLLHFIDFFDARQFVVTDPLFGYCTAVVATIELQQSFSNERTQQLKARINYDHCMAFLHKMSRDWPYVHRLTQKVEALADQMSQHDINDSTLTVDISGFLEILDLASSSRVHGRPSSSSIFGPTLCRQASDEETSNPTPLSRLPAITTLDPAKATGRNGPHTDANLRLSDSAESATATSEAGLLQPQLPSALPLDSGRDMFLPADQLLGGHLQDINAWWSGTWGEAAGSWAPNGFGRNAWPLE